MKLLRAELVPFPSGRGWTNLEKALDAFRSKEILSSVDFEALSAEFKAEALSLSGVWSERFLADLYASLQEALASGVGAREWLPEASKLITAYGGTTNLGIYGPDLTGESLSSWYADLVMRQTVTNSLNAGRYAEMFMGPSFESDPFWMFQTSGNETVCEICAPLDGQVFSKIDGEGRKFLPQLHFSCVCIAADMSAADVQAGGYDVSSGFSITSPRPADGFDVDGLSLVPDAFRRAA